MSFISKIGSYIASQTGIELISDPLPSINDHDVTLLDVPGYTQLSDYTCGYVAGLMILHSYKPEACVDEFWYKCNLDEKDGMQTEDLSKALRESGLGTSIRYNMSFKQIAKTINEGFPIAVCVEAGGDDEHWGVIYGVREGEDQSIFFAAGGVPLLTSKEFSWKKFLTKWESTRVALVCWGK